MLCVEPLGTGTLGHLVATEKMDGGILRTAACRQTSDSLDLKNLIGLAVNTLMRECTTSLHSCLSRLWSIGQLLPVDEYFR